MVTREQIPNTKSENWIVELPNGALIKRLIIGRIVEPTRSNYYKLTEKIFNSKNDFKILDQNATNKIIYLTPAIYWEIYKKFDSGKTYLTTFQFEDDNGITYSFPSPQMYFDNTFSVLNGGNGIYGIYNEDKLIYIGYALKGFKIKFDYHRSNFTTHNIRTNSMYGKYDINEIEFRELITEEEIQKMFRISEPLDEAIFQVMTYTLIQVLNPIENKESLNNLGQVENGANAVSLIHAIKTWLISDQPSIIKNEDIF